MLFRNIVKKGLFITLLTLSLPVLLHATQENRLEVLEDAYKGIHPTWLMMERGKEAFRMGELGISARIFREILSREVTYPDAEVWLGYIFEEEGELEIAEKQYLKALDKSNQMYILEDRYNVMYRLADIYRRTDQYGKYEQILMDIIESDESFKDNMPIIFAMDEVLEQKGFDKMFELYRFYDGRYIKARSELGTFYYSSGRYNEAILNLLVPVVTIMTSGFEILYNKTGDYEYHDFESHFSAMMHDAGLREYAVKNDLFRILYYLGASLYADGRREQAEQAWRIIIHYDDRRSTWHSRAGKQLSQPYIESIIKPRT